ncbi:uncharacterized protein BX663DRAFT_509140 [Cokeromyces recurvatus]|uniref:uncharacterized protein n=1 Tax=Cokeromyces recurvatus TaxID=90255 RepID=UPI00221FA963|nr:uncharacterized protein BX663DRAFT_509140 [Cokeromyces recurvatus]KAI7902997.1 hypothetical protein BX663DRAFT_509140 [Cokeromyces recurvatus]
MLGHSFSNCPLRSSSLLITHHKTQSIVTATDEALDLLGYSLSDLLGNSIHILNLKLSSEITCIPECTIKHANGQILNFQVCVHQDPLVQQVSSCLDYWLIRLLTAKEKQRYSSPALVSILRLSPYGTIEQIQQQQQSPLLKQSTNELMGRPIMAFVYNEDIPYLCANLAKLYSSSTTTTTLFNSSPLFIRWLNLPYLISSNTACVDNAEEESLRYEWMSFTLLMSNEQHSVHPICLIRPLQIPYLQKEEKEEDLNLTLFNMLMQHIPLLNQLLKYGKHLYQHILEAMDTSANESKAYINEFYKHVVFQLVELISTILMIKSTQHKSSLPLNKQQQTSSSHHDNTFGGLLWDLFKSNLQRSSKILEFTGLLNYYQTTHLKTCIETLNT